MCDHLASGLAAAQAAALASRDVQAEDARPLTALRAELTAALDGFDEPAAQAAFDAILAVATVDTLLADVVLPYLQELGERWERGEASIAQEHFAGAVLRGRLLGLARGWGRGVGPVAVLACLPGEQHDLGLIAFGLALRQRGWRVIYLGTDAPVETVAQASGQLEPDLIVLFSHTADRADRVAPELRRLARRHRVALGGGAARAQAATAAGILTLTGDPLTEAERASA